MTIGFQNQGLTFPWCKRLAAAAFLGLLVFGAYFPALAGDSLYGKVTEVKSADVVMLDYGVGQYELKLVGIDVPKNGPMATKATEFVTNMVLGKNARMRFKGRSESGEMRARLYTDDPDIGIKEVGVELVRAGLARHQKGYNSKYGVFAAAEKEAQSNRRGLWATGQTQ